MVDGIFHFCLRVAKNKKTKTKIHIDDEGQDKSLKNLYQNNRDMK